MFLAFLFAVLTSTAPDTISHRITFTENQLAFSTVQGYDHVELDGALSISAPGYPSLPRKSLVFAIPAGSCISDIEFVVLDSIVLTGTYSIWPAQPSIPISWDDSIPTADPDSVINSLIYNWPDIAAQGSELGSMDVTELARVDVFPLVWNPVSEELTLRKTIEFNIILDADSIPAPS